jgi:hypothetical protein
MGRWGDRPVSTMRAGSLPAAITISAVGGAIH